MNERMRRFGGLAKDLYFSGMLDFEKECKQIASKSDDNIADALRKVFNDAHKCIEDDLYKGVANKNSADNANKYDRSKVRESVYCQDCKYCREAQKWDDGELSGEHVCTLWYDLGCEEDPLITVLGDCVWGEDDLCGYFEGRSDDDMFIW